MINALKLHPDLTHYSLARDIVRMIELRNRGGHSEAFNQRLEQQLAFAQGLYDQKMSAAEAAFLKGDK